MKRICYRRINCIVHCQEWNLIIESNRIDVNLQQLTKLIGRAMKTPTFRLYIYIYILQMLSIKLTIVA